MFRVNVSLAAGVLLATACITSCSYVLRHGLCKPNEVNILPIDYQTVFGMSCWEIIYVANTREFRNVDHAFLRFVPNGDGTFQMIYTRVLNDGAVVQETSLNFYRDNIVYNEYDDPVTGGKFYFEDYPLAMTSNNAALFVRCSREGGLPADTRYIAIPITNTLTKEDIQELLKVDRQYNFVGNMIKLPEKLKYANCY